MGYSGWALLVGFLIFIGVWIYSITEWGLLIGLMIGWLPAIIAAFIGGLLWPLVVAVLVFFLIPILF
jgi:hypothetical protein